MIYLVITEDRHNSTDARPFTDRDEAIGYAGQEVADCARHPELSDEWDRELNEAMIADGWIWYCKYSVEGDSVRVVERELDGAPGGTPDEMWAAGYFDARGGYYFRSAQVMLIFTDKNKDVLDRFAKIIGHGWIRPVKNGTSFALQVGAQGDVREVTERFRPLITRGRLIEQMDQALADERIRRAPETAGEPRALRRQPGPRRKRE